MFFHRDIAEGSRNHSQKINAAWQAASEDMYKAQQQAGGQNPGQGFDPNNMGGNPNADARQQGNNLTTTSPASTTKR